MLSFFLFVCFKKSYAALHISCSYLHSSKGGRRIPFPLSPLWDLVSIDLFNASLSEQYEG